MKKKFLFFSFLLLTFYCFAGADVSEYDYAVVDFGSYYFNVKEVYVTAEKGTVVKEFPDENSKTLMVIPANTQIRIIANKGPLSNVKTYKYSDIFNPWMAIFLPENLRKGGNQIGWIYQSNDLLWYPDEDAFVPEKWGASQLNSYLLNHVWELNVWDTEERLIGTGIVVFEQNKIRGMYFSTKDQILENKIIADYRLVENKIEITGNEYYSTRGSKIIPFTGLKEFERLEQDYFGIREPNNYSYYFSSINPGTFLRRDSDFKNNFGSEEMKLELLNFTIKESRKFFRIYTKDFYHHGTISDYLSSDYYNPYEPDSYYDNMPNPYNLKTLAIAYGVWLEPDHWNDTTPLFELYWAPYIYKYEHEILPQGIYSYRGIYKPYVHLYQGKNYRVTESLKLQEYDSKEADEILTMNKDTKVQIITFGETLFLSDSLSSWVKVQVIEDTVDSKGKLLPKGTEGWCLGSYLSEIK